MFLGAKTKFFEKAVLLLFYHVLTCKKGYFMFQVFYEVPFVLFRLFRFIRVGRFLRGIVVLKFFMGDTILERLNYLAKINETNFIKQLVLVKIFIFFNQERVNIDALKVLFVMLKKSENIVKAVVIQLANIPYF